MQRNARIILVGLSLTTVVAVSSIEVSAAPQRGHVVSRQNTTRTQRSPRQKATPEKKQQASGPMEIFSDIEKGWRSNKIEEILKHFGKSKVAIAVQAGPSGGKFSKSQSYYLLKDLFKYTITKKFEFVQYRRPSENGKTSFAVAERLYQKTDDGRLFKDKIYVSLHIEDGGRWVVNEIKSIR